MTTSDRQRARAEKIARDLGVANPGRSLINALLALVEADERTDIPRQIPTFKPPSPEKFAPKKFAERQPPSQPEPQPELTLF